MAIKTKETENKFEELQWKVVEKSDRYSNSMRRTKGKYKRENVQNTKENKLEGGDDENEENPRNIWGQSVKKCGKNGKIAK